MMPKRKDWKAKPESGKIRMFVYQRWWSSIAEPQERRYPIRTVSQLSITGKLQTQLSPFPCYLMPSFDVEICSRFYLGPGPRSLAIVTSQAVWIPFHTTSSYRGFLASPSRIVLLQRSIRLNKVFGQRYTLPHTTPTLLHSVALV